MGKSITCNYHCTAQLANGTNPIFGAMSLKEAKAIAKSIATAYKTLLVRIDIYPQTKTGERVMKKDFLIIDAWGNIQHYEIGERIPFYTF